MSAEIQFAGSLDGMMNVVYQRRDLPIVHVIAKAPPGSLFTLDGHFDKCEVCKHHDVTLEDFEAFMRSKSS